MSERTLLTIVSINFNNASGLRRTIDSIKTIVSDNVEYLIVDGNSSDGSRALLDDNLVRNNNIKVVIEKDRGIYDAMNKGWRLARGRYIAYVNSGDEIIFQNYMNYIKFIQANDADVFYAKTYLKDERGGQNKVHIRHWEQLNRDTLPHLATITRRALIDSVGGFDERYRICADRDLFIRLRERGARAIFFDEVVSVFELGGISSTRNTRLEDLEINRRHHLINPIRYFLKKAIYLAQKTLR